MRRLACLGLVGTMALAACSHGTTQLTPVEMDTRYLNAAQGAFPDSPPNDLVAIGHTICDALARGQSQDEVEGIIEANVGLIGAHVLVIAAHDIYCPHTGT